MWTNATRDLAESTTFIKLIQQQDLNTNLGTCVWGIRCWLVYAKDPPGRNPQHGLRLASWRSRGGGMRVVYPLPALHPGTSSLVRCFAADLAAWPSLFLTHSHLQESSLALHRIRGHLGIALELMRPPITFICFENCTQPWPPYIRDFHLLGAP
jgi:hypothetical protein